jgi:hypothetical protein
MLNILIRILPKHTESFFKHTELDFGIPIQYVSIWRSIEGGFLVFSNSVCFPIQYV